jgi:hypothetical protein
MVKGDITMHTVHSIIRSIREVIRLGASFDISGMSFEIEAADIENDLMFGRS